MFAVIELYCRLSFFSKESTSLNIFMNMMVDHILSLDCEAFYIKEQLFSFVSRSAVASK